MTETNLKNWEDKVKELKERGTGGLPSTIKGKVVDCTMTTAGVIFGEKTRVWAEKGETLEQAKSREMVKITIDTGYEFDVIESLYLSNHPKSNMGKFVLQYGDFPKVGQEVTLIKRPSSDGSGRTFYRILL